MHKSVRTRAYAIHAHIKTRATRANRELCVHVHVHMPPASPSAAPAAAADGWRQLDAHALAAAAQPFAKGATWSKPKQRMARARKADVRRLDPAVVVCLFLAALSGGFVVAVRGSVAL